MTKKKVDLIILGGGTGGLRLALDASKAGLRTALVESGLFGGTCINTGCIPTKALLQAAHTKDLIENASYFGINAKGTVNAKRIFGRVNEIRNEAQFHIKKSLNRKNLSIYKGKGSFVDANTIEVKTRKGTQRIYAKKIIISTGAKNLIPPLPNIKTISYLDNVSILNLKKIPKSVIVIGGGYISMEFATFFSSIGSKVTILEYAPQILSMLDSDVVENLLHEYEGRVTIHTGVSITDIKQQMQNSSRKSVKTNSAVRKTTVAFKPVNSPKSKAKKVTADALIIATGRGPNTDGLALEKAGVNVGKRKEIVVDKHLASSRKHIFALGDVNGRALFAHAAKREAKLLLHNLTHGRQDAFDFDRMPWAVFTHPVVAGIGLSERQAIEQKIKFDVYKAFFANVGRAEIIRQSSGFVKVITKKDGTIVGATIIGPQADDLIHEIAALMNSSSPNIKILRKTIHAHPTLSEVMDNLRRQEK